ncbi:MAG: DUF2062 domain-containing protein [Alcanivoracaceae bacterium]|jgi:uncharacterized protein (DUF2062 family)|nr:DUF2062 domain-containing protein [Alcanivoracaceae bacterium]
MPKRLFRKYLPSPDKIRQNRSLGFLGAVLSDPNLWHINRRSLAGAAFIGIFSSLVPIPLQMLLAAALAVRFKCNLPLSVVLVWFTNPLTIVPVFYFTYRVGAWILGMPVAPPSHVSFAWLIEQMIPLWFGSILCGLVFGGLSWAVIKLIWRMAVSRSWTLRKNQRRLAQEKKRKAAAQDEDNLPS